MDVSTFGFFRVRYYCENSHTFYLEKLISSHCFLNKYSKDFFDNGVGTGTAEQGEKWEG